MTRKRGKGTRKPAAGYAVGYGRPPIRTRFRPGQSGNPKGRPKGARNAASMARDALERKIPVTESGTKRNMTVREVSYRRLGYHVRRAGDLLHPEREPMAVLDSIRSQLGSDTFAAQYQQRPVPPGGVMIRRAWVRRYDQLPIRTGSSYIVQSWDTASKAGGKNDFSVCTTWLIREHDYYLLEVLRGRLDYPLLRARAISHAHKHKPNRILIEDAGVGTALVAELKSAGLPAVAIKPEGDKLTRMSIQSIKFESGHVFFPHEAPWLAELEAELFAFPNAPHDDQVDSISQALAHTGGRSYKWDDKALEGLARFVDALYFPF